MDPTEIETYAAETVADRYRANPAVPVGRDEIDGYAGEYARSVRGVPGGDRYRAAYVASRAAFERFAEYAETGIDPDRA